METIKLITHIDNTGKLYLEVPTSLVNQRVEVLVVLQPTEEEPRDALGWPIGYFEETYGLLAEEPLKRAEQGIYEEREATE